MEGSFITTELGDTLAKVAVFLLVQGLVFLILSNSSDVFSKDKKLRSLSFRSMRSMSVRRVLAPPPMCPSAPTNPPRLRCCRRGSRAALLTARIELLGELAVA
ncbi:hypothetical protein CFC21_042268 [Triticum aestivum]|uniref:Uncharacterized protein n=2 Tax=Triticum aestivum TaxID=4565 RepID=A0A9R1FMR5_WHEAT|nr:hypothetical protein CFC21_042268 [Triticum aestivum]CDM84290.1 unnamed protein product [Triticum aestivum]